MEREGEGGREGGREEGREGGTEGGSGREEGGKMDEGVERGRGRETEEERERGREGGGMKGVQRKERNGSIISWQILSHKQTTTEQSDHLCPNPSSPPPTHPPGCLDRRGGCCRRCQQ